MRGESPPTPLRALIVDDSDDDMSLIERALRRGGYQVDAARVESAESMRAALDMDPWDVIIADYTLPHFRGLDALRLLQESGLDIPFILVSGSVTEDVSVGAMKAGAHDFVGKDNLVRLAPAVGRELEEARVRRGRRQAEEALREQEQLVQAVINSSPAVIFIKDMEGRYLTINHHAERVFRVTQDKVLGKTDHEIHAPEIAATLRANDQQALETRMPVEREEVVSQEDGLHTYLSIKFPLLDTAGVPHAVCGISTDITDRKRAEEELARLHEAERQARAGVEALAADLAKERGLLDTLLSQAPVGFAFLDRRLRFVRVNDRLAETFGLPAPEYLGRTVQELAADLGAAGEPLRRLADSGEPLLRRVLETGEPLLGVPVSGESPATPGAVRHWRLSHYPVRGADGVVVGVGVLSVETTEHVEAEAERQRLLEQERAARAQAEEGRRMVALLAEASRAFAEAGPEVQHVLDAVTRRLVEGLGNVCGIKLLSENGRCLHSVALDDRDPERLAPLRELAVSRPPQFGEEVARRVAQTGKPLLLPSVSLDELCGGLSPERFEELEMLAPCSMMMAPLRAGGRVTGTLSLIRRADSAPYTRDDLALLMELADRAALAIENARLYGALAERERQLQDLVGRLILAQEEERRRIAYNVHDGVAQVVAGTHLQLRAFARRYRPRRAEARQELDRAIELAQRAVREARTVVGALRPTALDDLGLEAALRAEVEELQQEGWEVEYEAALGPDRLEPAVETALFRVCQEALTNARKHARAPRARVALRRRGRRIRLEVRDWGQGFDPAAVACGGPGERVGLSGMRERVALLGGRCEVKSRPGAGTRIVAEVPLRAPAAPVDEPAEDTMLL